MVPANATNGKPSGTVNSPRSPATRPSPSKTPSVNGIGRSPSLRGGAGLSRPSRGGANRSSPQTSFLNTTTTLSDDADEDEARAEHTSLMDELRSRVQKTETASEEYQRQLNLLQARLEESQQEQGQLEERLHETNIKVEELENEKMLASRQKRDLENIFETERTAMMQDKAEQRAKEEELQTTIQRLKDNLVQREKPNSEEEKVLSRTSSGHFAPPSSIQRSDSKERSKVAQKDRVIESLRLELAEAQIKVMEMDSTGGGHVHELEKTLLETKITNARLMEDNESFQLLLSEKTLNGDFSKTEAMQTSSGLGSLAEELGSEELENAEGKSDDYRRLEVEVRSLKDQNKALALYIENIIGRLLSHKEFENILDKTPDLMSGAPRPRSSDMNKDLPPPPPPKEEEPAPSILQRARSVVAGSSKRPRPKSQLPSAAPTPAPAPAPSAAPNEDPATSLSIPLGRSQSTRLGVHKRSQSEMPTAGAPLVNQMYRGPPSSSTPGPVMSPGISPGVTAARTSFFSPAASLNPTPRNPSASRSSQHEQATNPPSERNPPSANDRNPGSSSNSTFSDHSREGAGVDSPPRNNAVQNNYTGAVMTQNRLRPLRLVQENKEMESASSKGREEEEKTRKKANRGSWMPSWIGAQRATSADSTHLQ